MSAQEFEQADEQVIDMVNNHAAPQASANAEQIAKDPSVWEDPESMIAREVAKIRVAEATRKRKRENRNALICILVCLIVAAALLVVLAVPSWLIWLVNVGIVSCCTTAGIIADRYAQRNSGWQQ